MASRRPGQRQVSPLLVELRRWERRARRGLLPPDDLLPAWEQRIAEARRAESIETAELERRLGLILRARVNAHVADLEEAIRTDQPGRESALSRDSLHRLGRDLERASRLGADVADARERLDALRQAHLNARVLACEQLASEDAAHALREAISLWPALVDAEVESGRPGAFQPLAGRIAALQGRLEAHARRSAPAADRATSLAASKPMPGGALPAPHLLTPVAMQTSLLEYISRRFIRPTATALGRGTNALLGPRSFLEILRATPRQASPDDVYPPIDRPLVIAQVELDWIDGEPDPWQRSEVIDQARAMVEAFARQGARVRLVRGRPIPPDQYNPASIQTASALAALAAIGPATSGDLDILENAVLVAGRPGFLRVIVPPVSTSRQTSAASSARVAGQFTRESAPSRLDLPLVFPSVAVDEAGATTASEESTRPAIESPRREGTRIVSGRRGAELPFDRYRHPPTTRPILGATRPLLTPPRALAPTTGPLIRTSLPGQPSARPLPPVPPPVLQRETAPEALPSRVASTRRVRIALDWVAGESPRHKAETLARAREAARLLEESGMSVEIIRGRDVPAHRYDRSLARRAGDFSIPGPAGPVALDRFEVLEQSMLEALRPGFVRVLVAPAATRAAGVADAPGAPGSEHGSFGPPLPLILPRIEPEEVLAAGGSLTDASERTTPVDTAPGTIRRHDLSRPAPMLLERMRQAQPSGRLEAGSPRPVALFVRSGRSFTDADGSRATRRLSPSERLPFGSSALSRIPAAAPPVRIVLDWVAGENPWQRGDAVERVSETVRELEARGLRVQLLRGHAVPLHRYSTSQERRAAELSLPGPTGPVALDRLDIFDRAAVVVQRPGLLQVVIAPTRATVRSPLTGSKRLLEPPSVRSASVPIRDWISGGPLDLVLPAIETMSSAASWEERTPEEPSRMIRTPAPTRDRSRARDGSAARSDRAPGVERLQVVVDWVAGQDPWRKPDGLGIPPDIARDLARRGVQVELVRGRELPGPVYQSARAMPAAAFSVTGPRGPVTLAALSWLEGAIPIAQRPGRLQVVLPAVTVPSGAYATAEMPLAPSLEAPARDTPSRFAMVDIALTRAGSSSSPAGSVPGTTTLGAGWAFPSRRISGRSAWRLAAGTHSEVVRRSITWLGRTTIPPVRELPTGPSPILATSWAPADSSEGAADADGSVSPMPRPGHTRRESFPWHQGGQPEAHGALLAHALTVVSPLDREPFGGISPVGRLAVPGPLGKVPMVDLPTSTSARSGAVDFAAGDASVPLVESTALSVAPLNVLIFDVERATPELPPLALPNEARVQHPTVGTTVTNLAPSTAVHRSSPPRPPAAASYPPLTFAKDAPSPVLPLRQQDVARAASDRPPVEPARSTPPTASSSTGAGAEPKKESKPPDLDTLARQVYALIKQRLVIEKERMGINRSVRPW